MPDIEMSPVRDIEDALNAAEELSYTVRRLVNDLLGADAEEALEVATFAEGKLNQIASRARWAQRLASQAQQDLSRLRDAMSSHGDTFDEAKLGAVAPSANAISGRRF